jgi:hypothetical protein
VLVVGVADVSAGISAVDSAIFADSASVVALKAPPAQGVQKPALWAGQNWFSGLLVAAPLEVAEKVELPGVH